MKVERTVTLTTEDLEQLDRELRTLADKCDEHGFTDYWSDVFPTLAELWDNC